MHKFIIQDVFICAFTLFNAKYFVSSVQTADRINAYGYPLEIHNVQTEDNYMIGIERIPHKNNGNKTKGKPVILLPGLYGSSMQFVVNNDSLGFVLADAGFDVWLLNYRLLGISKFIKNPTTGKVIKLKNVSWDFGMDELAKYDMTVVIDYVLEKTGYPKVDLVGFSLGGTIALIGLSEKPQYNNKIDRLVLIAPTSRMRNFDKRLITLKLIPPKVLDLAYTLKYVPRFVDPDNQLAGKLCDSMIFKKICLSVAYNIQGVYSPIVDDAPKFLSSYPQPTSIKVLRQYFQFAYSKHFRKYDYGRDGNLKHYNSTTPAEYNLSNVAAPTIIVHSKSDTVSASKDVKWLIKQLPNVIDVHYITEVPFPHQAYTLSPYAKPFVNTYVANKLLNKY
ncbi:lipase member K-like [Adelges cooleyi]|uniref:lipase member K-like n=1 Tax=Adelges cooleyi TaxID=133065 RepID=UPI00217F89F7|nr:lipase member K-like [Adelges cooleyi]